MKIGIDSCWGIELKNEIHFSKFQLHFTSRIVLIQNDLKNQKIECFL